MSTYMEIAKRYKPATSFKGEILLFKSQQNKSLHKYLCWDSFCDNIKLVMIKGNHKTLYTSEDSYKVLSKNIEEWLQRVNSSVEH